MISVKFNHYKKALALAVAAVMTVAVGFASVNVKADDRVVVEESKNPQLTFTTVHGINSVSPPWTPKGSYEEPTAGDYTIKTNAWAQWYDADSLHFANKKYTFNYGKLATLVAETQVTSWNGLANEAGAGIMIRSSLDANAATVLMHVRPGRLMVTYRSADKASSMKGKELATSLNYPVGLRISLTGNKAKCAYKNGSNGKWIDFATVPFVNTNPDIYVGVAAYSQDESQTATAKFSGLSVVIDAPKDYQQGGGTGGDSSDEPSSSEEQVSLPEDLPVADNVLLMETFTDGSLSNTPESKTNWLWEYDQMYDPAIKTSEDNTNRYLYDWAEEDKYYYAGDQSWTDYETSMDLTFTSEYADDAANALYVYVRHTDIVQYGFHDYVVYFKTVKGKGTINIGYRKFAGRYTVAPTAAVSADLDYLGTPGVTHNLRVVSFDNKITVFWDGQQLLTWADTSPSVCGQGEIGFMTNGAAVQIDNIKVTKLEDLLGGDYDNRIGGNWDEPLPDYLKTYSENGWTY